ncbi:hypothetical protein JCM1840_004164 [Sporobolomyces johnsonii]
MLPSLATLLLPLAFLASSVRADTISGLAGSIDNAAQAASLQSAAKVLSSGSYTITNVATGQSLTYDPNGNDVTPQAGNGTPVSIMGYGGGVSWVRLQIGDKDKCLSSQWGGSYNLAGVMYSCAVTTGGQVTRQDNTLEPTKQWWLMVPVDNYKGNTDHSNHLILAAQAGSVATREAALKAAKFSKGHRRTRKRSHADVSGSRRDISPRRFELVSRAQKARKDWRTNVDKPAARKVGELAARNSKSSSSRSKKSTKPKTKSNSSSTKKASTKAKSSNKAKTSSKKKTTSSKKSSSSSKSSSPINVKLNVASSSNKYFIIPVDHLIDMHTLALTGHQIQSAGNAQSTALDLWNATDEYQHWIVTPA